MLGPTTKGLGKGEEGNWNKAFLLWDRRIRKEISVNARPTGNGYHVVKPPPLVQGKITEIRDITTKLDEDILEVMAERVPRERFVLPQTSAQDIGWCQALNSSARPRSTLTGLVNWKQSFKHRPRTAHPQDHHVGHVTLVGDFGEEAMSTDNSAAHMQGDRVEEQITNFQQWLPRIGQTRYFHPTSNSDLSLYADAYLKTMTYWPFSKTAKSVNK